MEFNLEVTVNTHLHLLWSQKVPLKRPCTSSTIHSVISQKKAILIMTAVKTPKSQNPRVAPWHSLSRQYGLFSLHTFRSCNLISSIVCVYCRQKNSGIPFNTQEMCRKCQPNSFPTVSCEIRNSHLSYVTDCACVCTE